MRLTKFEHAGLLLEQDGRKLFIDPGSFTSPLTDTANAVAIVITHEHPDHWTPEQLNRVLELSPDATIYAPEGVAAAATDFEITVVHPGDTVEVEPFALRFFGGRHAVIHESIPVVDNVGVLVNDDFYYPGDSYAEPGRPVKLLAAPVGAPYS